MGSCRPQMGPMSTPWTLLSGIYFPCSLSAFNRRYLTWASRLYHVIASSCTVYPKKYAHGFCFAVLCCGYALTDFPISIRLTSLALWQSNDCPSASKATLMNMECEFIINDYITTTKQSTTKPCAYFLGYTVLMGLFSMALISVLPQWQSLSLLLVSSRTIHGDEVLEQNSRGPSNCLDNLHWNLLLVISDKHNYPGSIKSINFAHDEFLFRVGTNRWR